MLLKDSTGAQGRYLTHAGSLSGAKSSIRGRAMKVSLVLLAILTYIFARFGAQAGEMPAPLAAAPTAAISFEAGARHFDGFVSAVGGQCHVAMTVTQTPDGGNGDIAAQVAFVLRAGQSARLNPADPQSPQFSCDPAKRSMSVRAIEASLPLIATK